MLTDGWNNGPILRADAKAIICAQHYLHSFPSGWTYCYHYDGAVVVYSIPANKNLGPYLFAGDIGLRELARLWAPDDHRKNLLTEAIACSLRALRVAADIEAVVSFADPNHHHHGGVYQAASWIYTGQSAETRVYRTQDGRTLSRRSFHSGGTSHIPSITPCRLEGKYRYVRCLTRRARRALRRESQPYPKHQRQGDTMTSTQEAIAAARERMRKQEELIRELEAREAAKAVVVEAFTRGDSVAKITADFALSETAVRKILTEAGKLRVVKRKLDVGDEAILVAALRTGEKFDAVAERLGFAKSVVRGVAKKHGIRQTRAYTQKRSAAEIETLRALERQLKAQFGAGFAGLGEALRKANAAERASEGQVSVTFRPSAPVGEPLSEAERASEPVHPVSEGVDVNGESEPSAAPEPDLSTW